jgi:hypothetical protein
MPLSNIQLATLPTTPAKAQRITAPATANAGGNTNQKALMIHATRVDVYPASI